MIPSETLKLKKEKQMSVEQLADRYSDKYYVSIEYKNNGDVLMWIGAAKHDPCGDCLKTMKTEAD